MYMTNGKTSFLLYMFIVYLETLILIMVIMYYSRVTMFYSGVTMTPLN